MCYICSGHKRLFIKVQILHQTASVNIFSPKFIKEWKQPSSKSDVSAWTLYTDNFFIVLSLSNDLGNKRKLYGHYVSRTLVTDKQTGISAKWLQMIFVFIMFIRSDPLGSCFCFTPGNQPATLLNMFCLFLCVWTKRLWKNSPRGGMIYLSVYDWLHLRTERNQSDCFITDINKWENCLQCTQGH